MVVVVEWGAIYFAETGDLTGVSLWLWILWGGTRRGEGHHYCSPFLWLNDDELGLSVDESLSFYLFIE
jgi:hypothetical protein